MAQTERDDEPGRSKYGRVIHFLRWERGWSLRDLAERSGIPDETLSRYERSGVVPIARLEEIARAFGLTVAALADLADRYSPTGLFLNRLAAAVA